MAGYILNEAIYDKVSDSERISQLEAMIDSGELAPVKGKIMTISYRVLECPNKRRIMGPNMVVLLEGEDRPSRGIAFKGTYENMEAFFEGYDIQNMGSLRLVECYLDPETSKIFALKC